MARPQPLVGSKNNQLVFPNDLTDQGYGMSFFFVKYQRKPGTFEAQYIPTGTHVVLPMPLQIMEAYNILQDNRDLGIWGESIASLQSVGSSFMKDGQTIANEIKQGFKNGSFANGNTSAYKQLAMSTAELSKYLMLAAPNVLQETGTMDAASKFFGFIKNPHTTLIFNGVNLRQHEFSWNFSPRNEQESRTLHTIINEFRRRAHPTYTPGMGSMALDYPDYVYVNWIGTDYLYPIKRSAIQNITVNNTGGGQGAAFYKNGAPVAIQLTIQLTETEILTREDFGDTVSDDGTFAQAHITQADTSARNVSTTYSTGATDTTRGGPR